MTRDSHTDASALDWFGERYQAVYVSRNRWFLFSIVLGAGVIAQALALVVLMPLKTSVPFLVREETSGSVIAAQPLIGKDNVTFDEAVRKYFVAKYVQWREVYDPVDLLEHYRGVELMSDTSERGNFRQAIVTSNPGSPLVLYGDHTKRRVMIKSISFLTADSVQVRFTAVEHQSMSPDKASEWIATLKFRFVTPPGDESDRLINPLGFQIISYRVDQEVVS